MIMFFPNLKNLKQGSIVKIYNDEILEEAIDKLDNWLIAMNEYKTYRLNPKQFANDKNINNNIARKLFLVGSKQKVFKMFIEARSDENGFLDNISLETYNKLLKGEEVYLYSEEIDDEIEIFQHNVKIWFRLLDKPVESTSFFEDSDRNEVTALSNSELTKDEILYLMG